MLTLLLSVATGQLVESPRAPAQAERPPLERINFSAPRRLVAAGQPVRTPPPGYATPTLFDLTGDGLRDLVVGHFKDGRIKVYPALAEGRFAEGEWLMAGGEIAQVPGVW
ncbi:hypothetical protein [Engelhardtia mirabilis]|uniref:FG-GAP repeat protein n=1 Tax=Engelhardtia mirabilis TaxID=2528011 RepID=A0A518BJE8_9BACT|nr:hypothetical protein Pla133_21600 [Planctomycetes bacterium Pla133]QDV01409.1 hypothetical protein Pla86_21600 [Planctomycetes bacterium Pla86]